MRTTDGNRKYFSDRGRIRFPSVCIVCFIGIFCLRPLYSQISIIYDKSDTYEFIVNPAITGRDYYPFLNLSIKKQWAGIPGSPVTACLGSAMRLGEYNFYTPKMMLNKSRFLSKGRIGVGGFLMQDSNGPLSFSTITTTFAYFVPLMEAELSFGLAATISYYNIDESLFEPVDPDDQFLYGATDNKLFPDADFGVYYHTSQYYIGASVKELFESDNRLSESENFENSRDFFFITGYKFFFKYFEMEPSVFAGIIDKGHYYYRIRNKFYYNYYNWVAFSYGLNKSLKISIGTRYRRIYFGYAFEQQFSKTAKYNMGSHELMIGLNIGLFELQGIRKVVK